MSGFVEKVNPLGIFSGLFNQVKLADVREREQLDNYYKAKRLTSAKDKVNHLIKAMKIRATMYEGNPTDEEKLIGLESEVFDGVWRALCR